MQSGAWFFAGPELVREDWRLWKLLDAKLTLGSERDSMGVTET